MGLLKGVYTQSQVTGAVEFAIIERYDEVTARTAPGFDDLMGEPFLPDTNADGVGDRTRPGISTTVLAKFKATKYEEQEAEPQGNAPTSAAQLTLYEKDLKARALIVAGAVLIRPNDRLLRLQNASGVVRVDFLANGRDGLFCTEVVPGETGSGIFIARFETRRKAPG